MFHGAAWLAVVSGRCADEALTLPLLLSVAQGHVRLSVCVCQHGTETEKARGQGHGLCAPVFLPLGMHRVLLRIGTAN